jgi:hypothetical protein
MQRIHRDLLVQQPQHSFQDSHWHNGASRNELLSDQVLNMLKQLMYGVNHPTQPSCREKQVPGHHLHMR